MSKGIRFTQPSRTVKSASDETDINVIVARGRATGNWGVVKEPRYVDCTQLKDFHSCMNKVKYVGEVFAGLPAVVRDRFSNDPMSLVTFLANPANRDEAVKLGLVKPLETPPK